jgi:hypothetical protein
MSSYMIGSLGSEVNRIQEKLASLGFYKGTLDSQFGGGTYAAVKAFQQSKNLKADGVVGPITWDMLFGGSGIQIPAPSISTVPLDKKCLALTGAFETGKPIPDCFAGLSGDFDDQGISFGVLQWNFGQGSLQPLLNDMIQNYKSVIEAIFHENFNILINALNSDKDELMTFARSIQHPTKHFIYEPWQGMFKALGRTNDFQNIQVNHSQTLFAKAKDLCNQYGLLSDRAKALMFDIKVQNGSIKDWVKSQILSDFERLPSTLQLNNLEVEKMKIIANRRAEAAKPKWVEDVRARKLCIANGTGYVHGIYYDLANQFCL